MDPPPSHLPLHFAAALFKHVVELLLAIGLVSLYPHLDHHQFTVIIIIIINFDTVGGEEQKEVLCNTKDSQHLNHPPAREEEKEKEQQQQDKETFHRNPFNSE